MAYERKDGKKQVVTRMTPDLIWAVKVRAAKNKTTFMGILEQALSAYLTAEDEKEKRAAPPAYAIGAKPSESAKTEQKEIKQTTETVSATTKENKEPAQESAKKPRETRKKAKSTTDTAETVEAVNGVDYVIHDDKQAPLAY